MKRIAVAVLAVFVAWSVLDTLIHGVLLRSSYEATAILWRPMAQMKMGILHLSVLVASLAFVFIYASLVSRKSLATGLKYGFWFGLGSGVSMGYCTYAVMPIPQAMALVWFLGALMEAMVGGLLIGWLIKQE